MTSFAPVRKPKSLSSDVRVALLALRDQYIFEARQSGGPPSLDPSALCAMSSADDLHALVRAELWPLPEFLLRWLIGQVDHDEAVELLRGLEWGDA